MAVEEQSRERAFGSSGAAAQTSLGSTDDETGDQPVGPPSRWRGRPDALGSG
jgi:hypothetical protein